MEFTNNTSMPDWVHKGLTFSNYNRDGIKFDLSATKAIDSPLISRLWREHGREVIEDSMDRVWSAWGTATHAVFEEANKANSEVLMEKRFLSEYSGKILSGQVDVYEVNTGILSDIKTCAAFKVMKGDNTQWENQLNFCAQLMRDNGYKINKLQIVAIIKDWSAYKASNERNYPEHPVAVIDIPLWTEETAKEYIEGRVEIHYGEGEKNCSDAERWIRPGRWAVMKKGRKNALRLLDSEEQCKQYIAHNKFSDDEGVSIVERKAQYVRCESYCVFNKMGVCPNYKQENK